MVVPRDSPLILRSLPGTRKVRHLGGCIHTSRAMVSTPIGPREAMVADDSHYILPEYMLTSNGTYWRSGDEIKVTFEGKSLDVQVIDDLPFIHSQPVVDHDAHVYRSMIDDATVHDDQISPSSDKIKQVRLVTAASFPSDITFSTGKRHTYFTKTQQQLLNNVMNIKIDGECLFNFVDEHAGIMLEPAMAIYIHEDSKVRKNKVISPRPPNTHSDKNFKLNSIANDVLCRVSVCSDFIYVSDVNDEVPAHGLHIFLSPVNAHFGSQVSWGDDKRSNQVYAIKEEQVAPDYAKILDTSASELMSVLNDDDFESARCIDLDFCHDHSKFDIRCEHCVHAGLKSLPRFRRKTSKGTTACGLNKLSVDIQLLTKSGPYCLVGAFTKRIGERLVPMVVCEAIMKKNLKEMRRSLSALILNAQSVSGDIIKHVHSDREQSVESLGEELMATGIRTTFTQGFDPKANSRAEAFGGVLSIAARARLAEFSTASEKLRESLWCTAMSHAAMSYNLKQDDTLDYKIYKFGSIVECRWPPKSKLDKCVSRTYRAVYLHPSTRVLGGHVVVRLDESGSKGILQEPRIAVTIVPVFKSEKPVFPDDPRAPRQIPMERRVIPTNKKGMKHEIPRANANANIDAGLEENSGLRRSERIRNKNKIEPIVLAVKSDEFEEAWLSIGRDSADENFDQELLMIDDDEFEISTCMVTRLCSRQEHSTEHGQSAIKKELNSLCKNGVVGSPCELSSLPVGTEVADIAMILSEKNVELDPGEREWKGRAVYRGDCPSIVTESGILQRLKGSDREREDTWVLSAADHSSVRMLLSYALMRGLGTYSADLKTAYLQAIAGGRSAYVRIRGCLRDALPPDLLEASKGMKNPVFKLERALYGRVRSGKDWGIKIEKHLREMGFRAVASCRGLFYHAGKQMLLAIYVDDLILACDEHQASEFFKELEKKVELKVSQGKKFEETRRFLGIEYDVERIRDFRVASVSMKGYCQRLIKLYEEEFSIKIRPRRTLDEEPTQPGPKSEIGNRYRPVTGALLWLVRCYRPDLAKAVSIIGQNITTWSDAHTDFLHSLLGVISSTSDHVMKMYFHVDDKPGDLRLMVDSDANLAVPRSTSGSFQYLTSDRGSFLGVTWSSKKQTLTCTSTASSEFIALSSACERASPILDGLIEIGVLHKNAGATFRVDNSAVLLGIKRGFAPYDAMLVNLTKSATLRAHQLSDLRASGRYDFIYVESLKNIADCLTKILKGAQIEIARKFFGVVGPGDHIDGF